MKAQIKKVIVEQINLGEDVWYALECANNWAEERLYERHGEGHNIKAFDKMLAKIKTWIDAKTYDFAIDCKYEYDREEC